MPTAKKKAAAPKAKFVASTPDWRAEKLARVRAIIEDADPDAIEEIKWRKPSNPGGVPVWSHDGIICTGETYKAYVKLTFAQGAALDDPSGLFNGDDKGATRRTINIGENDKINERALKALIRNAVTFNTAKVKAKKQRS